MSRQKISLNTLSGSDSRDLSVRDPAGRIRVSAWSCQTLSEVPACYLDITRGRVRTFYLPILPLYGFTTLYTNPFLIIYLLPNFKLPVLVLIWGLEQKKTKFVFPQTPESKGIKGLMGAIRSKSKSPAKKSRDVVMTSPTKEGESGSRKDRFPVPDLNVRKGLATMDPDQETVGFLTPKITK
jgi:hypothetical protein